MLTKGCPFKELKLPRVPHSLYWNQSLYMSPKAPSEGTFNTMKVNPEVIPPTKNLFYGHLKILTVSARILGLNNTHRCFIDWLIVPCVPIFFCGGCLFALIKLNIIFDAHVSTILRVVETIQLIASVFLVVANSLNAFNANRAVKKALRDLNLLEIQMASTKIKGTNYNRRITSVVLQLVVYSVIVLSVLLVHILFQHEVVHHPGIFYVIRFFPIYSIGVNVLQFVNIVAEVSSRLKALSGLVDQHISKDNPVPGRQLQLISVVYEMAFKVCKTLNDAFQFCNLFQIGYCFISITAKMFFVFLTLNNLHEATVQDMSKIIVSISSS